MRQKIKFPHRAQPVEREVRERHGAQAETIAKADKKINRLKCCGNCRHWRNRPDKMICAVEEINVSQWCYCKEWQQWRCD